jgi:2-polyprenyl-3-methyl-5-hydroxy-6-metoxy-1,4-benzoquinol methylase
MTHHQFCTLCHHDKFVALAASYRHTGLVQCEKCGFIFSEFVPSKEELMAHYAKYDRSKDISEITVKRYSELLNEFSVAISGRTILDVGCGKGEFIEVAINNGWTCHGTELDDYAVELCRQKGIQIFQGSLREYQPKQLLDVITSFEVIEHINNPDEELRKIHALLKPGGLFYFTTPNFNSLSRYLLKGKWNVIEYPEHLSYFTSRVIDKKLHEIGFKKIHLDSTGISIQRLKTSAKKIPHGSTATNADQRFREKAESKPIYKLIKSSGNLLLNTLHLGDTLKGLYRKV